LFAGFFVVVVTEPFLPPLSGRQMREKTPPVLSTTTIEAPMCERFVQEGAEWWFHPETRRGAMAIVPLKRREVGLSMRKESSGAAAWN
jgi:hypothetical protein